MALCASTQLYAERFSLNRLLLRLNVSASQKLNIFRSVDQLQWKKEQLENVTQDKTQYWRQNTATYTAQNQVETRHLSRIIYAMLQPVMCFMLSIPYLSVYFAQ